MLTVVLASGRLRGHPILRYVDPSSKHQSSDPDPQSSSSCSRRSAPGNLAGKACLLLTQADVVMEELQEIAALLPVVAAGGAGAPGSHVGRGVVQIVGRDCASCGRKRRTGNDFLNVYRQTKSRR